jgi:hypothetical protein
LTLCDLWKRAKGYGRINLGRVSDRGGTPRKTSEARGEIFKAREGGAEPMMLYLDVLKRLRKPSQL